MRAVWVAKYQPPPRTSVGRGVGDRGAVAEQDGAIGPRRGELGVVGGDEHGGARRGQRAQAIRERLLVAAVHAARRLVEQDGGRRLALQHDRQREPLALAAGEVARVAVGERAEAGRLERRGRKLLPHALGDQVVAGVLEQERDPPGADDAAARRLGEPGREPQQRRLARPVAAHQRHALARRQRHVHPAQHRGPARDLVPDPLERERGRRARRGGGRSGRSAAPGAARALHARQPARAQRGARVLDRDRRRREAGGAEEARARGLERVRGLLEEAARVGVDRDGAVLERDHAVGGGEAALEPVLGEHDRGAPLLVDAPQHAEQLVARDRVELGGRLVEQQQPRPRGERRAERHALELAARQLVRRAVEQPGDAERERRLLDPARDGGRAPAAVLERERELRAHRAHHHLRLGVLEQRAGDGRQLGRAVVARVEAAGQQPPRELAAVEVRHEARGGTQQRRLARPRPAGEHDELARLDAQRDVGERRPRGAWIRVGHAVEDELAHRPIPRRSANGSSAQASRPTASASTPRLERRERPRVGLERLPAEHGGRNAERGERAGRGGEREVVARPWPRLARRAPGAAVAAHLERRGDVDRAVERAGGDGAQDRRPRGGLPRPAALGVAEPPRVAREHRHHPRGQRRGQRRAEGEAAERAQQLVRVDGGGVQREAGDHDQRAQPEDAAVGRRLERHVDRAERRQVAEPRDHGQPLAHDERVDQRDQHRERQPPQQRAGDHAADARAGARQQHREQHRAEQDADARRTARRRPAPRRTASRPRRARRAAGSPGGDRSRALRPSAHRQRQRDLAAALDRDREVVAQARLVQRGRRGVDPDVVGPRHDPRRLLVEVARRRHEPGARAERAHGRAARVEQRDAVALGGRPGEDAGDLRPLLDTAHGRVAADVGPATDQHPQHRRARLRAQRRQAADRRARVPSRVRTSLQARCASAAHSIRTGTRLPCGPDTNGSGYEPTTAGMRIAAPQSWWSHHTRSPAASRRAAAPRSASMPLT